MKKSANRRQWAARSAIQKAIRRSDTGMLRGAFRILWDMDRSWLLWRLHILAIEEVWQYAGEAHHLARLIQNADTPASCEAQVYDYLETLCRSYKDHSTYALLVLTEMRHKGQYQGPGRAPFQRRWESLLRMFQYRKKYGDEAVARAIMTKAADLGNPDAELVARGSMDRFELQGGMEGDRTMALIGGFLALTSFGGPPPRARISETDIPDDWPWWVYDHHTSVGKAVFPQAAQELGMSKTELAQLSFGFTGGIRKPVDRKAFWPLELERVLDQLYPDRLRIWESRVRGVIQGAVQEGLKAEKVEEELRLPLI
jgi:hypothetical protein